MGLMDSVKGLFGKKKEQEPVDPRHNPYTEHILCTVPVIIDGQQVDMVVREVKNSQAKVMGGQAAFELRGEKVPVIISSPHADGFSIGVNIALHKSCMSEFKQELARLQEEGLVSAGAKLSYNPDTKNAILFRRSDARINGSVQRWKDVVAGNLQTTIDDFAACLPWLMSLYE